MSNNEAYFQQVSAEVKPFRKQEYDLNPLFLNRWSPRSYSERKVSDADLFAVLEAAHWAPSSFNDQPWRFFVAKTDEQLRLYHEFLNEFNRSWASKAPVLVVIASDKLRDNGDPNGAHAFDAGTAWGYLALQAKLLGLVTHAIGGFDREKARRLLNVPDRFELHAVVALGYQGEKGVLPEGLQEREVPNGRRSLHELMIEGAYQA